MTNELPGEWGERLGPKGIHSYRDMAAKVGQGVSASTCHRLVIGGKTSVETVNKVAAALFDGDRDLVYRLRGSARRDHGDWSPPPESSLLDETQRQAVEAVILAMVPPDAAAQPAEVVPLRRAARDSTKHPPSRGRD